MKQYINEVVMIVVISAQNKKQNQSWKQLTRKS